MDNLLITDASTVLSIEYIYHLFECTKIQCIGFPLLRSEFSVKVKVYVSPEGA